MLLSNGLAKSKIKSRRSKRECMSFRQPSINTISHDWFLIGTGQQAFSVILFWQVLGVQIFRCQLGTDHALSLSWDGNIVDNSFKSWEAKPKHTSVKCHLASTWTWAERMVQDFSLKPQNSMPKSMTDYFSLQNVSVMKFPLPWA